MAPPRTVVTDVKHSGGKTIRGTISGSAEAMNNLPLLVEALQGYLHSDGDFHPDRVEIGSNWFMDTHWFMAHALSFEFTVTKVF